MGNISMLEMLGHHVATDLPHEHEVNIDELLKVINPLLALWPHPVLVTSGYRSMQDHLRIYRSKGVPDDKIPMGSSHLVGRAVDISDPDLSMTHWLQTDPTAITTAEKLGLYFEAGNKNWVHITNRPPQSGNRWFKP